MSANHQAIETMGRKCMSLWEELGKIGWKDIHARPEVCLARWDELMATQRRLSGLSRERHLSGDESAVVSEVKMMILREELHSRLPEWLACVRGTQLASRTA